MKKKNRTWRAAALLLVLTLVTSCFVGGTFAKYVTSDEASDEARVAKWGVTVEVSGNLFGKDYNSNTADSDKNSIVAATSTSVSATDKNVVAPGTKNDKGLTIKIAGTPEVAYKITANANDKTVEDIFLGVGEWGVMVKAEGLNAASDVTKYYLETSGTYTLATGTYDATKTYYKLIDKASVKDNPYYPINWTYNDGTNNTTTKELNEVSAALINAFNGNTGNANVSAAKTYKLTWEWPFTTDGNATDPADTILGNLMAGAAVVKKDGNNYTSSLTDGTDYNLDIVFGMKVTVEQVD